MKRIVLFVEGEGEADAAPKLVGRLLGELRAWDDIILDENPFRVGHVTKLLKDNFTEWQRKLAASLKRKSVGGVLLLLDGDTKGIGSDTFCAVRVARALANAAVRIGGGATFSVGVVFARQEYETWLIAGIESLAGQCLSDGRLIAPRGIIVPDGDLEVTPRDAKGWLSTIIQGGYKPTRDQPALTALLDLEAVRNRRLRSFRRLESALTELVTAIRTGQHVVSPSTGLAVQ